MMTTRLALFDLVCTALPKEFDGRELLRYGKPEWHERGKRIGVAYSLRKCPLIDWERYLSANPDVRSAGVDPVLHFLTDGLYEGRKLHVRPYPKDPPPLGERPEISVIVYNHNDALFLDKSVGSLQGQTFKDLEILVVDDASTDESPRILRQIMGRDRRVRVIFNDSFKGVHLSRKSGVKDARGRYLMFLKSGDFLSSDCCLTLRNEITRGYDLVCFNTQTFFPKGTKEAVKSQITRYANRGAARSFESQEVFPGIYEHHTLSDLAYNKIYASDICKAAFGAMSADTSPTGIENYEMMVIATYARSALKLERTFYRMRYSGSALENPASALQEFAGGGDAFDSLATFLEEEGLTEYKGKIRADFLKRDIDAWLADASPDDCRDIFRKMAERYGVVEVIGELLSRYPSGWEVIANRFRHYGPARRTPKPIKSIGLLYTVMGGGGGEMVIMRSVGALLKRGFKVTVFLEISSPLDQKFPEEAQVVYLGGYGSGAERLKSLLYGLENAIRRNPVDVMLCHACYLGEVLWYIMLLKYLGVPPVLFLHGAFFRRLLHPNVNYSLQAYGAVMRCGDKVAVLSECEELYYRINGVNASYLPNPVALPRKDWFPESDFEKRRDNLLVFGRLGDSVKNVGDALKIFSLVNQKLPWTRLTLVGSFKDPQARRDFFALARKLRISQYVKVTGWLEDCTEYIDKSAILLSTAWTESFSLTTAEAQARGVPAVMYDLPIQPAKGNPAIIRVPLGDIRGAATQILALLNDETRWRKLSATAREKMSQFSIDQYGERLDRLLADFELKSDLGIYTREDYRTVMRALAEHGAHLPPWLATT